MLFLEPNSVRKFLPKIFIQFPPCDIKIWQKLFKLISKSNYSNLMHSAMEDILQSFENNFRNKDFLTFINFLDALIANLEVCDKTLRHIISESFKIISNLIPKPKHALKVQISMIKSAAPRLASNLLLIMTNNKSVDEETISAISQSLPFELLAKISLESENYKNHLVKSTFYKFSTETINDSNLSKLGEYIIGLVSVEDCTAEIVQSCVDFLAQIEIASRIKLFIKFSSLSPILHEMDRILAHLFDDYLAQEPISLSDESLLKLLRSVKDTFSIADTNKNVLLLLLNHYRIFSLLDWPRQINNELHNLVAEYLTNLDSKMHVNYKSLGGISMQTYIALFRGLKHNAGLFIPAAIDNFVTHNLIGFQQYF